MPSPRCVGLVVIPSPQAGAVQLIVGRWKIERLRRRLLEEEDNESSQEDIGSKQDRTLPAPRQKATTTGILIESSLPPCRSGCDLFPRQNLSFIETMTERQPSAPTPKLLKRWNDGIME
jgi:hypothetical protein